MTDVNTTEDFADDYDDAITEATAVIDNGSFGKRPVRFETGLLARQANGADAALDTGWLARKLRKGRALLELMRGELRSRNA